MQFLEDTLAALEKLQAVKLVVKLVVKLLAMLVVC